MAEYDLELHDVSKHFGAVRAVDHVTLQVRKGEFLSLLGPSGCGKTTSLRLIAGFERPTSGEIHLGGRAVGHTPPYQRNVNTVFQHYALFPHKTAFDNVAFALQMKKRPAPEIRRRVERMLELVELPGIGPRFPHQLSGGQQQRVALARALINEPTVLLLDEPLGALDLKVRRRMQLELKRIHREVGVTFVYVTHDQEEALTMSDRIAVMNHGRIEQLDTPAAIYEKPRTRFVASFIGMTNFFPGVFAGLDGGYALVRVTGGVTLRAQAGDGTAPGADVEVGIRPEKVQIAAEAPAGADNCLPGSVQGLQYQGVTTEYQVELDGGGSMRVLFQNVEEAWRGPLFPPGTKVFVSWAAGSSLLLRQTASAGRHETGDEDETVVSQRA